MCSLRRLVRQLRHERISVDGRAQGECQLHSYLHWHGRHRGPIRDRHREHPGAHRDSVGEPDHCRERCCLDPDLVLDQCDFMFRIRRLERIRGGQWQPNHRRFDRGDQIHVDLQRSWWLRLSVHHRVGIGVPARHYVQRKPDERCQRRKIDAHLVFNQCHRLHGVGRMVGDTWNERLIVDGGVASIDDLYPDLYWNRRFGQ
jgi:hypothetical protein